jgi:hypothetical protein
MPLASWPDRGLHGGDGFGLVVLDADQHLPRRQQVAKDGNAADDFLGTLAHQDVIAAHVGLALGAVDDQFFHGHAGGSRELGVTRKNRPTEADDAGVTKRLADLLGRQAAVIERRALHPLVATIGLDDHAQRRQTGGMRGQMLFDGKDRAGSGRVRGGRQPGIGAAYHLPLAYPLTDFDERVGRTADALMQRHVEARR